METGPVAKCTLGYRRGMGVRRYHCWPVFPVCSDDYTVKPV